MGIRNQTGQVFIETLLTLTVFGSLFLAIQALIDHHKENSNKYKLSHEVKYEIHSAIKK